MPDTKPHTFFVRLSAHGIGLNPGIEIPFERTNLPADAMQFRDNTELYWEVRIKSYSKDTAIVVVDVTDYEPEDITAFYSQQPRRDVHSIEFAELDWNHLSPHLSSYRKSAFVNLIGNTGNIDQTKSRIEQRTLDYQRRKENTGDQWLEFTMSFDKATFVTGGVLVTHKYKGQLLEILIPNGFILKEFDLLKHYIARFGNKAISCTGPYHIYGRPDHRYPCDVAGDWSD